MKSHLMIDPSRFYRKDAKYAKDIALLTHRTIAPSHDHRSPQITQIDADFIAPRGVVEQASSLLVDVEAMISAVPAESILKGSQDGYPTKNTAQ